MNTTTRRLTVALILAALSVALLADTAAGSPAPGVSGSFACHPTERLALISWTVDNPTGHPVTIVDSSRDRWAPGTLIAPSSSTVVVEQYHGEISYTPRTMTVDVASPAFPLKVLQVTATVRQDLCLDPPGTTSTTTSSTTSSTTPSTSTTQSTSTTSTTSTTAATADVLDPLIIVAPPATAQPVPAAFTG